MPVNRSNHRASKTSAHVDTERGSSLKGLHVKKGDTVVQVLELKNVKAGERIHLSSTLGVTNDLASKTRGPGSYVYQGEHRYDIDLSGRVVVSDQRAGAGGDVVSKGGKETIKPANHHGSYVQDDVFVVPKKYDGQDLYVKLVAEAHLQDAPGKAPKDVIDRKRPNGTKVNGKPLLLVDEKHVELDAVRLPPGANGPKRLDVSGPVKDFFIKAPSSSTQKHDKEVVMSVPLGAVKKGEVFDVEAWVKGLNLTNGSTLLAGYVTLSSKAKSPNGKDVMPHGGSNIPAAAGVQGLRKKGAIVAPQGMKNGYLNFVVTTGAGHAAGSAYDLKVLKGSGGMRVDRYTP